MTLVDCPNKKVEIKLISRENLLVPSLQYHEISLFWLSVTTPARILWFPISSGVGWATIFSTMSPMSKETLQCQTNLDDWSLCLASETFNSMPHLLQSWQVYLKDTFSFLFLLLAAFLLTHTTSPAFGTLLNIISQCDFPLRKQSGSRNSCISKNHIKTSSLL